MKRLRFKANYRIFRNNSKIHGYGVIAGEAISKNEEIVPYTGRRVTKRQSEFSKSRYIFVLDKRYDIDGRNIARYVNHSCEPNCETIIMGNEIWVCSIRDIKKGEELTYNYGYRLDEDEADPCLCRKRRCVGRILDKDDWPKLKKRSKVK